MNILHFHTHDSGRWFRHLGAADAPTEAVSRWARRGALTFTNAFSAAPTCSPSRAALYTGRYPHSCGMLGLAHRGFTLNDYSRHLVQFLNGHGYHTVLCGVQHEASGCFDHARGAEIIGYGEDISAPFPDAASGSGTSPDGDTTARWDRANARRAAEWLSKRAAGRDVAVGRDAGAVVGRGGATVRRDVGDGRGSRAGGSGTGGDHNHGEPFFLSVGLYATHREFPSPPDGIDTRGGIGLVEGIGAATPLPPGLPDTPEVRADHRRFLVSLREVDRNFKTVIEALERSSLAETTMVLVTTDHGIAQPYYKCNLNAGGQGIVMILKVPGVMPPSPVTRALVSTVDIFPTLCELLGLEVPPWVQGESFAHLLSEPGAEHREYIFGEVNFHTSYEPMRSVRTLTHSLAVNYDRRYPFPHLSNIDESPAKRLLLTKGVGAARKAPVELYDLETDPWERHNLHGNPEYIATAERLEQVLAEWQRDTDDPLLHGSIAAPPGAVVNRPQCVEPDSADPADYL